METKTPQDIAVTVPSQFGGRERGKDLSRTHNAKDANTTG